MDTNKQKILILNGPNLNLLGKREPSIYGSQSLDDIRDLCEAKAKDLSVEIEFVQTNHEGEMLDLIQEAECKFQGIVLNAAAYSHTSVALLDAVTAIGIPVIEVHLSNVYKRESFRKSSFVSFGAAGVIAGFGAGSYLLALDGLAKKMRAAALHDATQA